MLFLSPVVAAAMPLPLLTLLLLLLFLLLLLMLRRDILDPRVSLGTRMRQQGQQDREQPQQHPYGAFFAAAAI